MRTIEQITNEIKVAFIANETLQDAYSLDTELSFDEQFPASSVEANLIGVIAINIASLESLWDAYQADVESLILSAYPGTLAWYHNLVMSFEYGAEDEQIIKYAAIVEDYPNLLIKVNGVDFYKFAQEGDQLVALRSYLSTRKFAGTQLVVTSREPDDVNPVAEIKLDSQLYNSDGENLETDVNDVELAIANYLSSVKYNGSLNVLRLIDAIQLVPGVLDINLTELIITREGGAIDNVTHGDHQSHGGAFKSTTNTLTYVLA